MVKRDYIIAEASRMFETQGIKSVRIDDIAAHLGMSKRTLYEMFGSKDALLKECMYNIFIERSFDTSMENLDKLPNAVAVIFAILDKVFLDCSERERNDRLRNNLQKFYPDIYQYIEKQMREKGYEHVYKLFERGMKEGLFRDDTRIDLSISILTSSLILLGMNKIKLHGNISLNEAFEYLVINFFRGISTYKGIELIDTYHKQYRESFYNKVGGGEF